MKATHYPDPDDLLADGERLRSALNYALNQWAAYSNADRDRSALAHIAESDDAGDAEAEVFQRCLAALEPLPRWGDDAPDVGQDVEIVGTGMGRTVDWPLVGARVTTYEDMELRAPGTDDEPWAVLERVPGFNERIAEGLRQLKSGEQVEFAPADRSWALAVVIVALVVVAIVWRR